MSIVLEHLTKRYGGPPVVNDVSLEIADGEFFVLLGSSGSGKTTVLNMVAGLTGIDQGRILLHGRDVTWLPTQERRVGFRLPELRAVSAHDHRRQHRVWPEHPQGTCRRTPAMAR